MYLRHQKLLEGSNSQVKKFHYVINSCRHTFVVLAYKETPLLQRCIESVEDQSIKTNVVIATSTPNDYIKSTAEKYNLPLIVNPESKGIGYDFNFALNCVKTDIVTIAHQDDIYEREYCEEICRVAEANKNASIVFTDYYEIRNSTKEYSNINLKIKRLLLLPLKLRTLRKSSFARRFALCFGNAISCPSVSYIKDNIPDDLFLSTLRCNIDWEAWEKLLSTKTPFIYINKCLMGHTISEETTTSSIIKQGIRTKEDLYMYKKFWPDPIAKLLQKIYSVSEKGNSL